MPMLFIDGPTGLAPEARKTLIEDATAAMVEAYHRPDVRIFFRNYPPQDIAIEGRQGGLKMRPICTLQVPQERDLGVKRRLIDRLNTAMTAAYRGIADVEEVMVFLNEYPLEQVGWAGRLAADEAAARPLQVANV
jgi:phenylpyruvate tautomerase PptA (4-oxalocrotonate tautomerase family)